MVETSRRREIEDAASALFRRHGYAATSVRDIARALDIQGASLYAHVDSKQDVLWSIVADTAARFEAAAARVAADPRLRDDPAARLAAFVRVHVGVITEDCERASVFVHEWRSLGALQHAEILARRDRYEAHLRALIAEGSAAGAFAPLDPAVAARFVLTALNGLVTWYDEDGPLSAEAIAEAYAGLAVRSVGGTPPARVTPL